MVSLADVLLKEHNTVLEIQHSKISYNEVLDRKHDYELNSKITIWIIDGNKTQNIKKLNNCNRIFLEFVSDTWKFESFLCYEHIFIDITYTIFINIT